MDTDVHKAGMYIWARKMRMVMQKWKVHPNQFSKQKYDYCDYSDDDEETKEKQVTECFIISLRQTSMVFRTNVYHFLDWHID